MRPLEACARWRIIPACAGNARGTPTHLHYGIYPREGATDPVPRLKAGASMRPEDSPDGH